MTPADETVECELLQYHMQCVQKQFSLKNHHKKQFSTHLNQLLGKPAKHTKETSITKSIHM